jgi:hypothetical protein
MQSIAQYSSADEKCPEISDHNKQYEHLEFVTFSVISHEFKHRKNLCLQFQRVVDHIVLLRALRVETESTKIQDITTTREAE